MSDYPPAYVFGPADDRAVTVSGEIAYAKDGITTYPVVGITMGDTTAEDGVAMEDVVFFNMDEILQFIEGLANAMADASKWSATHNAEVNNK